VVKDDEGHMAEAIIPRTEEFITDRSAPSPSSAMFAGSSPPQGTELLLRAVLGSSLIFNAAAFALLRRRQPADRRKGG
jgi:hypothetical protein